jgi:membrane protease YdiL (CAAX protease family)
MGRWRVGLGWYAALLLPPVLILGVLLALSALVSPVFTPHVFLPGLAFGAVAGFFEEIGWTGFALPQLRSRVDALAGVLLLGVLWGLWHAPVVDFLGAAYPHGAYWLPFLLAFVALVAAMRVLISWVAINTRSVLMAQLLHASSTGCLALLGPAGVSPAQETLWYAIYAAVLWIVVALVIARFGASLTRQGRRTLDVDSAASEFAHDVRAYES